LIKRHSAKRGLNLPAHNRTALWDLTTATVTRQIRAKHLAFPKLDPRLNYGGDQT
jgi:hypothetical protein